MSVEERVSENGFDVENSHASDLKTIADAVFSLTEYLDKEEIGRLASAKELSNAPIRYKNRSIDFKKVRMKKKP